MAKKITKMVKLQVPAGKATPVRLDGLAGRRGKTLCECGAFGNDDL